MIRRLRLKFVCTVMAIVTLLLCAIFALVYGFTSRNLERESLGMMQAVAQNPQHPDGPGEAPEGVRLPYFILELDEDGGIVSASGGYYDLTDGELLETFTALSEGRNTGVLEDYGLRFCRVWTRGTEYLVFADMSSERSVMENLVENCLFIGALAFLAFLGLSLLLARWAVGPVARACLLSVENSGEPLSTREQRDIFKRFYRADRSRTGGSFGLGLAIARGIAGAHRGRIWAEAFEGGNRFCLRLRVQK